MNADRLLVVSTGDPQGIGPEISLSAARRLLARRPDAGVVLVGCRLHLEHLAEEDLSPFDPAAPTPGLHLHDAGPNGPLDARPPSSAGGTAALRALAEAHALVRRLPGSRLVTAPVSKEAIVKAGVPFVGHTDWLAEAEDVPQVVMLFAADTLRVALATVHLPLREVPAAVTREGLARTLRVLHTGLEQRFAIHGPRIAVLGLNPHAGEGGVLGREEIEVVAPAVAEARARGLAVQGPFSADSFFRPERLADFDAVLALYHDQGLLPIKALAFGRAVNVSLGLPFVRTSVDHGTAFDLAGRGLADDRAQLAALELALELES